MKGECRKDGDGDVAVSSEMLIIGVICRRWKKSWDGGRLWPKAIRLCKSHSI